MDKTQIIMLQQPAQIDLDHHGVIEAHAGTGKTYTIVQMVLRLLQGEAGRAPVHVREILLVTYTDKAAGELKTRIREGIETRIAELSDANYVQTNNLSLIGVTPHSSLLLHLSDCLNNLHEAMIGTIHSVCLRILHSWPFESGVQLQAQTGTVSDEDGTREVLYEIIRKDWQDPQGLGYLLDIMKAQKKTVEQAHLSAAVKLAQNLLDRENTVLDRSLLGGLDLPHYLQRYTLAWQHYTQTLNILAERFNTFKKLAETIAQKSNEEEIQNKIHARLADLNEALLQKDFRASNWSIAHKDAEKKIILKASGKFAKSLGSVFAEFSEVCPESFKDACEQIANAEQELQNLTKLALPMLVVETAMRISDRWQNLKLERGVITFQDMLRLTKEAVHKNPTLVQQLRKLLRYGIIDEFQDTSVLQWQIFRKIFLENSDQHSCKLFVVGDPKQSIYSVQGADVNSYSAAVDAILAEQGNFYGLVRNYRSAPSVIDGYNTIFAREPSSAVDWFQHERIQYPSAGAGGIIAQSPARKVAPQIMEFPALQIMPVWGSADERRNTLAKQISQAIRSLKGLVVSIPAGPNWNTLTLDYGHFAIITESHAAALPFMERLAKDEVPAVKYKMEGIFQSSLCAQLRVVLRAIANVGDHHENRLAALLTCFFQRHPIPLNPEVELSPESEFSKLLADLQELAALRRWGQLFEELQQRTHITTTLVRLADGERKLADLRQVIEYCLEQLVSCNWTLAELQEHLGALLAERVHVSKDKNQFTQASANSAVKVLTMHASKGLEFPVVFVIPTSSRTSASTADIRSWIDSHDGKLHLLLETSDFRLEKPNEFINQDIQERLRLLYVALTRPQVMLFLPLYLACAPPKDAMGAWSWSEAQLPKSSAEKELSPRLKDLLATNRLHAFDEAEWQRRERIKPSTLRDFLDPHWSPAADPVLQAELSELSQRLRELGLSKRKSLQTSYTELSHDLESERELGAAEEPNEPVAFEESALPRGKDTGDALHSVLEECIEAADWKLVPMRARLRASLERNRVLQRIPTEPGRKLALDAACKMVQQGMQYSYDMGPWGKFSLAELKANALLGNCRAELEFQLAHHLESAPHLDWLHGFMDVVFRVSDPANAKHPWRYHVLDWKTNSLPVYDRAHIETSIVVSHYDLQAKVYAHALHKFLQGLLGESYDPSTNLGAAVYVYLRAFEHNDTVEVWWHNSNPSGDAEFVAARIDAWKKGRQ